jgi:hypothetical protein
MKTWITRIILLVASLLTVGLSGYYFVTDTKPKYYLSFGVEMTYADGTEDMKVFYRDVPGINTGDITLHNGCLRLTIADREEDLTCGIKSFSLLNKTYHVRGK